MWRLVGQLRAIQITLNSLLVAQPAIVNSITKNVTPSRKTRDALSKVLNFGRTSVKRDAAWDDQPEAQRDSTDQQRHKQAESGKKCCGQRGWQVNDQRACPVHPKARKLVAARIKRRRDTGV